MSPTGTRAALLEAIARARLAGELKATRDVAHWPGFRRAVGDRVQGWRRSERSVHGAPPDQGPETADHWAIFRQYAAVLQKLDAEDRLGFESWASRTLTEPGRPAFPSLETVTILDHEAETPARTRAVQFFEANAGTLRVTISVDPEPALNEVYAESSSRRTRWVEGGYQERPVAMPGDRPEGLAAIDSELFRADSHHRPKLGRIGGLQVFGAPQGVGVGLVVAREVRRCLDQNGVAPEDILVLARQWDEDLEVIGEVLRSWGIPVSEVGRPRSLRHDPVVSALRLAFRLPRDGWETAGLVSLLRHGQFRPRWKEAEADESPARAASALVKTGVFRGKTLIRRALDRLLDQQRADPDARARLAEGRALVDRLIAEIEPIDQRGIWRSHAARALRLAASLGLGSRGGDSLERLTIALDDHAGVLDGLGQGGRDWTFADFADQLDSLVNDISDDDDKVIPGRVVVTAVDQARGSRGRHVFLVNLGEGTFPGREAVEALTTTTPDPRPFAREMAKFLGVVGMADATLTLVYPTRDEKGQEILAAGFLDELLRRFDPDALRKVHHEYARFDPNLIDHPDLAVAPADARVRAVALACQGRSGSGLAKLARDPRHAPALQGTAAALVLERARSARNPSFTRYEGRLGERESVDDVSDRFGRDFTFSPSQLETYLSCPFRFFMRYVLKLEPLEEVNDLDDDRTLRGQRVHEALEELEQRRKLEEQNVLQLDVIRYSTDLMASLTFESETDPGRHEIERQGMIRVLQRYVVQAERYEEAQSGAKPLPRHFELKFGDDADPSYPSLVIGQGHESVKLRGTIDRVDVLDRDGQRRFRVIDYKTGASPSKPDVDQMFVLQLPIYAQAVESLGIAGEPGQLLDMGYWELGEKGYKAFVPKDWPAFRRKIEARILETAADIRSGSFQVAPRKKDCTRTCDYDSVCRIKQVRTAKKSMGEPSP